MRNMQGDPARFRSDGEKAVSMQELIHHQTQTWVGGSRSHKKRLQPTNCICQWSSLRTERSLNLDVVFF